MPFFPFKMLPSLLIAIGVIVMTSSNGLAANSDSHEIYEESCSSCHETHAGDFAHANLVLKDSLAIGKRSERPVDEYLASGHGKLSASEATTISTLLTYILENDGLYYTHCRICHDPARLLTKDKLIIKNDVLVGRYSGRDIRTFLSGHGRLSEQEAEQMIDVLSSFLLTKTK